MREYQSAYGMTWALITGSRYAKFATTSST